MREIRKIIVHCSASDLEKDDSVEAIHELHTASPEVKIQWGVYDAHGKGWKDIGYHTVITSDGERHNGRPVHDPGAHCRGQNNNSIGICLTGVDRFTTAQLESLIKKVEEYMEDYSLSIIDVFGHYEFDTKKTCPNMNMNFIRKILA